MTESDAPQYRQYRYAPPPGGTVILLVRHGESAPAVEGVEGPMRDGHTDPPLDPVGEGQALRVAERLQHEPLDAIYVSKLQRTQQTAAPLAAKLGIEPRIEPDIHEVGLGDWEGWKFRKLTAAHDPIAIQMFTEQRWDAIPGAESNDRFAARLRAGIGRIHAAHPNQRVAAFVHGGVIGMTMSLATGSRPFGMIGADNGSISEIVVLGDEWALRRFNDTTHLEAGYSTAPEPMADRSLMPDTHYETPNGRLRGYLATPSEEGPRPGIVLIHEAYGMTDDIRRAADSVAAHGYVAFAPDLYSYGFAPQCLLATMRTLLRGSGGRALEDIDAAREFLVERADCTGKVGIIGFCMGGGFAILAANRGFDVAAPNYGQVPKNAEVALSGACPVVASYGKQDWMFRGAAAKLEKALVANGVEHDVLEYAEAGHGFMVKHTGAWALAERVPGLRYVESAKHDGWARAYAYFAKHLS